MPADLPSPPPAPDHPALSLAGVRRLVAEGHVEHALETAVRSALAKGKAALAARHAGAEPAVADEAARRFLEAVQAAAEELDRLALAVAEGLSEAE